MIDYIKKSMQVVDREPSYSEIMEFLTEEPELQNERVYESRWWDEYETVVKLPNLEEDIFVLFTYAETTGDNSPSDCGYESPGIGSLTQVFPKEITKVVYV